MHRRRREVATWRHRVPRGSSFSGKGSGSHETAEMLARYLVGLSCALMAQAFAPARLLPGTAGGSIHAGSLPAHAARRPAAQPMLRPAAARLPACAARIGAVRMQEAPFWENVGRFARFFVSAVSGLILGLLSPFAIFTRSPLLAAIGAALALGFFVFLYVTLQAMQAPPEVVLPRGGVMDPGIQSMLKDIYGP